MTLRNVIFGDAFEALAIPDYVFSLSAEEQASAARKLDAMMAAPPWNTLAGYVDTSGEPLPDEAIGTDPEFDNAISYNLALRMAPSFGKQVAPYVKGEAKRGLGAVTAASFVSPVLPGNRVQIAGGGSWRRRWSAS